MFIFLSSICPSTGLNNNTSRFKNQHNHHEEKKIQEQSKSSEKVLWTSVKAARLLGYEEVLRGRKKQCYLKDTCKRGGEENQGKKNTYVQG